MKTPDGMKILTKLFPKIRDELKRISEYAEENPSSKYFFFVPEDGNIEDGSENFETFKNMVESFIERAEAIVPTGYKVLLHNEFWYINPQRPSMGIGGHLGDISLVLKSESENAYYVSRHGRVFQSPNLFGRIQKSGKFKSGRVYSGVFMYDETIARIKEELELAKTPKLLKHLKSNDENKIILAIKQLFKSTSELSIPNILQIVKEWPIYESIFKSNYKNFEDLEALAISISESKTRFTKEVKAKIIPFCNSTQFDVQYLAMKTMKGKWTRVDKEKLTKILVRGNFAIQLLKLEAMTEKKIPGTLKIAMKLTNDKNELVRNAAVDSLGELGKEKELKYLLAIGKDEEKRDKYDPSRLIKAINEIKTRLA